MEQPPVHLVKNGYLANVDKKKIPVASGSPVAGLQGPEQTIAREKSTGREQA